jgi:hypothetical protein
MPISLLNRIGHDKAPQSIAPYGRIAWEPIRSVGGRPVPRVGRGESR